MRKLAEEVAHLPLVDDDQIELDGHVDGGDEDVADGQRDDEQVGERAHHARPRDHEDDDQVAEERQEDDEDVNDDERHHQVARERLGQYLVLLYEDLHQRWSLWGRIVS